MASELKFLIDIDQKLSGDNVVGQLAKTEQKLRSTERAVRNLERAQKRLNRAGKAGSDQFVQVTNAKSALQSKLAGLTSDYANLVSAQGRAGAAGATAGRGMLDQFRQLSPALDGAISRFGGLSIGAVGLGAIAVAAAAAMAAVVALAGAIAKMTAALVRTGVEGALFVERIQFSLTNLLGSTEAASKAFDEVSELAVELGLDVNETLQQFQQLQALQFGVEESKNIIKMAADMRAMGADAQKVQAIIRAMGQIKGKGVLQMEELQQQLAETGISTKVVVDQLAEQLGKTPAQIRKMISAGEVNAEQGIKAIQDAVKAQLRIKELGEAAGRAANTLEGLWGKLMSRLQDLKNDLGKELLPLLKDKFGPILNNVLELLESDEAGKVFQKVVNVAKSAITILSQVAEVTFAFVKGLFEGLAGSDGLGDSMAGLSPEALQRLTSAATELGNKIAWVIEKMMELIEQGGPGDPQRRGRFRRRDSRRAQARCTQAHPRRRPRGRAHRDAGEHHADVASGARGPARGGAMNARLPVMPRTRADCIDAPRPCPHVGCRYHTRHVAPGTRLNARRNVPPDGAPSCALDVADEGAHTLREVGDMLGLTRERIRQIEARAFAKLERALNREGLELADLVSAFEHAVPYPLANSQREGCNRNPQW